MKAIMTLIAFVTLITASSDAWARGKNCRPGQRGCRSGVQRPRNNRVRPPRVNREQRRRDIRRERQNPNRRPAVIQGPNYRQYRHTPYAGRYNQGRRYQHRHDYFRTLPRNYVYNNTWVRYHVGLNYGNGYMVFDNYPYYVYNGYRHRYSHYDQCDYDLVDSAFNQVASRVYGLSCAQAYDRCANLRDDWNWQARGNRFFCSEVYDY